jgi:hypothetical protein
MHRLQILKQIGKKDLKSENGHQISDLILGSLSLPNKIAFEAKKKSAGKNSNLEALALLYKMKKPRKTAHFGQMSFKK